MKYLVRFFVIILITFYSITNANTEELSIVYMNMKKVMNETIAGKSLSQQLEIIHKSNITYFKKSVDDLKKEEASLISQKNILSNCYLFCTLLVKYLLPISLITYVRFKQTKE